MLAHQTRSLALLFALSVAPLAARAQELPGLDLSQPEKPPPKAKEPPPEKPPPRTPSPDRGTAPARDDEPGMDLAGEEGARAATGPVLGGADERDAALGDRVKAVQRKGFLKRGRFELGVSLPATVNDAFYQKVGAGGRLAYHLHDSFALRLRGDWFSAVRTGRGREGKVAFSSQLLTSQIDKQALLDGVWSPIYGKISWLGSRIVHFDVFLLAGFGLAWSATSSAPRSLGPHLATEVGGGMRFYPADWLALEGGLTATLYPDQPVASVPGTMQRVVAANLALSVFWPFGFEYRYP